MLILVVVANREFLVYGDKGIHEHVGQEFWLAVRDAMMDKFRQNRMAEAVCDGVRLIGEKLSCYFRRETDDKNEIPDEVAYDE